MTGRNSAEERISRWLTEEAQGELPDWVLRDAFVRTRPLRQARSRPVWRFFEMPRSMRLVAVGAAAIALLAIGLILGVGGGPRPVSQPTPSPSAGPSATASASIDTTGWSSFTSSRHGFTIRYSATWTVTPATAPWPVGQAPSPPSPELDLFTDPAGSLLNFVVISQPLAGGTTPDVWLTAYEKSVPSMPAACWPAPAGMEQSTVSGQAAWVHGGLAPCGFTEAVTFAGGRVYELTAYFTLGATPVDRALFDALLASVTLNPSAADDSPVASPSPQPS